MKSMRQGHRQADDGNTGHVERNRRPLARIYEIHSRILSGGYPNCFTLARELGVERKTIQRDISFMRDKLGLPLLYHKDLHGYSYDGDISDFPVFEVSFDELATLFFVRHAMRGLRGTRLADALGEAFSKITVGMLGRIDFSWADLEDAFSRKEVRQDPGLIRPFGRIAKAILDQVEITFHYRKLGAAAAEARKVRPLHLGEIDGGWYLIAHDLDRDALRTYALPRMTRVRTSSTRFARPAGFNGPEHLCRSFGVWHVAGDTTSHLVRVELRGYAARLAQERRWHPTQEIIPLNDDGTRVEVRFEIGRLEEMLRWVLSFGSQAKVLDPPELKRMLREELRAMARE